MWGHHAANDYPHDGEQQDDQQLRSYSGFPGNLKKTLFFWGENYINNQGNMMQPDFFDVFETFED